MVLGVIGFARAVSSYGMVGVQAYAKLLIIPALIAVVGFMWGSPFAGGQLGGLVPTSPTLRRISIIVVIATLLLLALAGLVGVGWLINQ